MTTGPMLSVRQLRLSFGGVHAVADVGFDVAAGEVLSLIGPNGAGKTTVFNLVSGIYSPSAGGVVFEGIPITGLPPDSIARRGIARTFQNIELFEHATTLQNLLVGRHLHHGSGFLRQCLRTPSVRAEELRSREFAEKTMEFLALQRYRDTRVSGLPYGVRKVIELGRALCAEPRLLLLDEPSSGLNHEETALMAEWIERIVRSLAVTVLMVEHDMKLIKRVSSRVVAMAGGRVLATGTSADVLARQEVIDAYLGTIDDVASLRRGQTAEAIR